MCATGRKTGYYDKGAKQGFQIITHGFAFGVSMKRIIYPNRMQKGLNRQYGRSEMLLKALHQEVEKLATAGDTKNIP